MTRYERILNLLPATSCEIAAIEGISVRLAIGHLYLLKKKGLAHNTYRRGQKYMEKGPAPTIWDKT